MLRPVLKLRHAALVAGCALLVACPSEQPQPGGSDAETTSIGRSIVTSTRSATATGTTAGKTTVPPSTPCTAGPAWIGVSPCTQGGYLYGSGEFKGEATTYLARATAASRARKRIAQALGAHDNDEFTLQNSEIDQVFACEGVTHALARVPVKVDSFKACAPGALDPEPPAKGCPAWVSRMTWREGDVFYAVAPMFRVMRRSMAEQSAVNRARQMVAEMLQVRLAITNEGVTSSVEPTAIRQTGKTAVDCNGSRWLKVAFERGPSDAPMLHGRGGRLGGQLQPKNKKKKP